MTENEQQLEATRRAFDSVAADYDGPRGNNELIQEMRAEMWRWLDAQFAPGSRLIDIGCGTGLDAVRMANRGHQVLATDWSPAMVARTIDRAATAGLAGRIVTRVLGAQQLAAVPDASGFDGAYSNLGPLNCVPDLAPVAAECARLVRPGGKLVFTVIGRLCPWEWWHYGRRGRWRRIGVRFARGIVPVGMNGETIWTRYYLPRAFWRPFRADFALTHWRGLCLFAPPPYLTALRARHPRFHGALWRLDRRLAGWPLLRSVGDHFLIVMTRR
jgi:SAM-dependent methyltransferase